MKEIKNLTENQINQLIEVSVKKHLQEDTTEEGEDNVGLLRDYINTSLKFLERIKNIINHPDTNFILQDDDNPYHMAKGVLENANNLYMHLKKELGSYTPKPAFNEKEFKEPVKVSRRQLDSELNESKLSLIDMMKEIKDDNNP